MVAEYGVGGDLRHQAVVGIRTLCQIAQDRRAGRRMVDADIGAFEPSLELRVILAEVVEQAGDKSQPFKTERRCKLGCQFGGLVQVD